MPSALFKHIVVYRIGEGWIPPDPQALDDALTQRGFVPCTPTQQESFGWVPARGEANGAFVQSVGGQWILKCAIERKSVPASAVAAELQARCKAIESERGRKPGRKEQAELKDEILLTLLPRAFSKRSDTMLWLNPAARTLIVGAGSVKAAEAPLKHLVDIMAEIGHVLALSLPATQMAPASAMAHWLTTKEPPWGFTIDRDLELKKPGEERSTVRYNRHTLELDEIAHHIREGKLPTSVAMTWDDRVSFVLTDTMAVRKIELRNTTTERKAEAFDADVALTTGELQQLLPALFDALGGEVKEQAATA